MGVIRISPSVNMGQLLARQINISNESQFQYILSGTNPIPAGNPGLRYNDTSNKWQFSHNGTLWNDFGTGSGSAGGGMSQYIVVSGTGLTGNVHLSNAGTWGTSKSAIKMVIVETAATDWDLFLLQNDNGYVANDANIPALQLMKNGRGNEVIYRDAPYEDEDATNEVHLFFRDNLASNTTALTIVGVALQ